MSTKKQYSFYAFSEVEAILDSIEDGLKSRFINQAIISHAGVRNSGQTMEERLDHLEKIVNLLLPGSVSKEKS